ncbi:DUF5107 domain-containing protein [Nibricoccus sp. IMCC34717]|uniref:tetratricopeptide repeat protein n=1 Tax=Nibricoccus sp. IMCC34717 TaxID=3034021 RepID=UPI00385181FE
MASTSVTLHDLVLPTYATGKPDRNPMFFEKRVYQGSSGRVYPLPFIDQVASHSEPRTYRAITLENAWVRLTLLPEIGGRIFIGQDKTNNDYDFFYRQQVIKPALVGLAGPWISGGVEFNWPQHHRPGTFTPTDFSIESEPDGAVTVWFSELDLMSRLKGMHGIRLRPDSNLIELRARLHNPTSRVQTFLWWANVAARVHDEYQSFFPDDVDYVADHAVRAMSTFPNSSSHYYGVPYHQRPGAADLRWYRNIPVPTSYMVCETSADFFGGYDYSKRGGFLHIADRTIAPGKKQWTWGNHPFGWAWDRELTDEDGPYIELMAGVFTDNQPDFSYLYPHETRTFSQYWWPYRGIGAVQMANHSFALHLERETNGELSLGAAASIEAPGLHVELLQDATCVLRQPIALSPAKPWLARHPIVEGADVRAFQLRLVDGAGNVLLEYKPSPARTEAPKRNQATAIPPATDVEGTDLLFLSGEHLEQYRHPTRNPEDYWRKALTSDPGDSRSHLALGRRCLGRGLLAEAVSHFRAAIERLTHRHPNPCTGEAHYQLGIALSLQGRNDEAKAALAKAAWDRPWSGPANYEVACLELAANRTSEGRQRLQLALATQPEAVKARVLLAWLDHLAGDTGAARAQLEDVLRTDPLNPWALHALGEVTGDPEHLFTRLRNHSQTILDLAFDLQKWGLDAHALALLQRHHARPEPSVATPDLLARSLSTHFLERRLAVAAGATLPAFGAWADGLVPDYFFPSRLEEEQLLRWVLAQEPQCVAAAFGLGNLLYDKGRKTEAIAVWESVLPSCKYAPLWRNLGIAHWNTARAGETAEARYQRALELDPTDARHLYEFDQLRRKRCHPVALRKTWMLERSRLLGVRDDAMVELALLHNLCGEAEAAIALLRGRPFHPWEGGEGRALRQWVSAHLLKGAACLEAGKPVDALAWLQAALCPPVTLGETFHGTQEKAEIYLLLGLAHRRAGNGSDAHTALETAATGGADIPGAPASREPLAVLHRALACLALGRKAEAAQLGESLFAAARALAEAPPLIDYFATSLPDLLLFDDNPERTQALDIAVTLACAHFVAGNLADAQAEVSKATALDEGDPRLVLLRLALGLKIICP